VTRLNAEMVLRQVDARQRAAVDELAGADLAEMGAVGAELVLAAKDVRGGRVRVDGAALADAIGLLVAVRDVDRGEERGGRAGGGEVLTARGDGGVAGAGGHRGGVMKGGKARCKSPPWAPTETADSVHDRVASPPSSTPTARTSGPAKSLAISSRDMLGPAATTPTTTGSTGVSCRAGRRAASRTVEIRSARYARLDPLSGGSRVARAQDDQLSGQAGLVHNVVELVAIHK
jgi:hypothetical protein